MIEPDSGVTLHKWATDLFPLNRSLTGSGVRETLRYLQDLLPDFDLRSVPSGTRVLDWVVPDEWTVREAFIADSDGRRLVDWKINNLHLVGYSKAIDSVITRDELLSHLHWLPEQPNAIPYVTTYYERDWGFCVSANQLSELGNGPFHVRIDADLKPGRLDFAEAIIPGESEREVLLTSYVCHPSMANNELSGPVVLTALGRWLKSLRTRRYTYRLLLAPETIGAITYLSRNLDELRARVDAGWVLTCIGDDRAYSFLESRKGNSLADRVSLAVLREQHPEFSHYTFLDRGSDERQWCAPGVDLPVCSVMRSKYGTYPEYHTSLDDLTLVTPAGLQGGLDVMTSCLTLLELNKTYASTSIGEPQMSRRGLYPTMSKVGSADSVADMMNVLAYCDGTHDTVHLSQRLGLPALEVSRILSTLEGSGLVTACPTLDGVTND